MSDDHDDHDRDHDHPHGHDQGPYDAGAIPGIHRALHSHLPPEPALRVKALESLLVEKGMLDPAAVDAWIEFFREEVGPKRGAAVVAKAWVDPAFRTRLLADAARAIDQAFGYGGIGSGEFVAVENTPEVHNLVVCTLCSCYPLSLLGIPPNWYKTAAYRARAVRDPRGVIAEFGETIPEGVTVKVWDSTSELRYLVVPERPAGTEGWDEARLARLVTRNAMIGTERDLAPHVAEIA
ncbi:MAG TPA: nitrile hydratase subunit alpha [Bauldia sp.]|nr:nitrile hydratase subunit alpha [Bauldia sp.]